MKSIPPGVPSRLAQDPDVLMSFEKRRRSEKKGATKKSSGKKKVAKSGALGKLLKRRAGYSERAGRLRRKRTKLMRRKFRSKSRGRPTSAGRTQPDKLDYLSVDELSTAGNEEVEWDTMSVVSNVETIVVEELIDVERQEPKTVKKKRRNPNSRVERSRSRSRDKKMVRLASGGRRSSGWGRSKQAQREFMPPHGSRGMRHMPPMYEYMEEPYPVPRRFYYGGREEPPMRRGMVRYYEY